MNWDAQSDRAAIRYYSDWCPDGIQEAHRRGARWQREALLSDEAVERAARALYETDREEYDGGEQWLPWPTFIEGLNDMYRERARVALTAAIGDDHE